MVYRIDVPVRTDLTIRLTGLTADLDFFVFTCSVEPAFQQSNQCIGGSAESNNSPEEEVIENALGIYYIVIDGYNSDQRSSFIISAICGEEAEDICDSSYVTLSCGESKRGSNVNTRNRFNSSTYASCLAPSPQNPFSGNDVLYRIDVPRNSDLQVTLTGLSADLDLFIFNCIAGNARCIRRSINPNRNSESITIDDASGFYYIAVDGYNSQQRSSFTITANCIPRPQVCNSTPIPFSCGQVIQGNNLTSGNDVSSTAYQNCHDTRTSYNGNDLIYKITLETESTLKLSLEDLTTNLDLFVFRCDEAETCIAKGIKSGRASEFIDIENAIGTYYIVVDGINPNQRGYFSLSANCITPLEFPTICDYGGTFINKGNTFPVKFTSSDIRLSEFSETGADCVTDFYGSPYPDSLVIQTFIYHHETQGDFSVLLYDLVSDNFNAFVFECPCFEEENPALTECDKEQVCLGSVQSKEGGIADFGDQAPGYYFILVVAEPGDSAKIGTLPMDKCDIEPIFVECDGQTNSFSVTGQNNNFERNGTGFDIYSSLYSGSRNFSGEDMVFQFRIEENVEFEASISTNEAMGLFLYSDNCGNELLSFDFSSTFNSVATIKKDTLFKGIYHLIVDKETIGGNGNFDLTLKCNGLAIDAFINLFDTNGCGEGSFFTDSFHIIQFQNLASSYINPRYDVEDKTLFSIGFKDEFSSFVEAGKDIYDRGEDDLIQIKVYQDVPGGAKCGFLNNNTDSLIIYSNDNKGPREINADLREGGIVFKTGERTSITNLRWTENTSSFFISPASLDFPVGGGKQIITVSTNSNWAFNRQRYPWLSAKKIDERTVEITVDSNDMPQERRGRVVLVNEFGEPRFITVQQCGVCTPPKITKAEVENLEKLTCANTSVTLVGEFEIEVSNKFTLCKASPKSRWINVQTGEVLAVDTDKIAVTEPGNYIYEVTDEKQGCSNSMTILVERDTVPPIAIIDKNFGTLTCLNSIITLDASMSLPDEIDFSWQALNGGNILTGDNSSQIRIDEPGTYLVTTTKKSNGCIDRDLVSVTSFIDPPTVDIIKSDEVLTCDISALTLSANPNPTNDVQYLWDASDGGAFTDDSDLTSSSVQVNKEGTYTVTIIRNDNNCSSSKSIQISSDGTRPEVSVEKSQEVIDCINTTMDLSVLSNSGSNLSYEWSGRDGATLTGNPLSNMVTAISAGFVDLKVTNLSNGCFITETIPVEAKVDKPELTFNQTALEITCDLNIIDIEALSSNSADLDYQWSSSDGGNIISPTNTNAIQIDQPGSYFLQATRRDNGCSSVDTVDIASDTIAPEVGIFKSQDQLDCRNTFLDLNADVVTANPISFEWLERDGAILTGNPRSNTVRIVNAGTIQLNVTDLSNGCSTTKSIDIEANLEEPNIVFTQSNPNLNCEIDALTIDALASTPTGALNYEWFAINGGNIISGQNTSAININQAGTYLLTASRIDNGCVRTESIDIQSDTEAPEVGILKSTEQLDCNNPTLDLTAQVNNTTPLSYQWTGREGAIVTGNPFSPAVRLVSPGLIDLNVTDLSNGCSSTETISIISDTEEPSIVFDQSEPNLTCDIKSLTIDASSSSPSGSLNYQWASINGGNIISADNLSSVQIDQAGTYLLTAKRTDNGCIKTESLDIEANTEAPNVNILKTRDQLDCNTPTLNLIGNYGPLIEVEINWSHIVDGETIFTNRSINPLEINQAGEYKLTVTNLENGCSSTEEINIERVEAVSIEVIDQVDATCPGSEDGKATITASGGLPGYTYLWSNGSTDVSVDNLGAGTWEVQVIDQLNCAAVTTVKIGEPDSIKIQLEVDNESAIGAQDGKITAIVSGGNMPYLYSWSNGVENIDATTIDNLEPDIYTLLVTDKNGCTAQISEAVNAAPCQEFDIELIATDVSCENDPSGTITVKVSGGSEVSSYKWSVDTLTGDSVSGLFPGIYEVVVSDVNGCSSVGRAEINAVDNVGPTLIVKDIELILDENGQASITPAQYDNGSFDNCSEQLKYFAERTEFNCDDIGQTIPVLVSLEDESGNISEATSMVTIVDQTPPEVEFCPDSYFLSACDLRYQVPTAIDNCTDGLTPILLNGPDQGDLLLTDTSLNIEFEFRDNSNNVITCSVPATIKHPISITATLLAPTKDEADGGIFLDIEGGIKPYTIQWSNVEDPDFSSQEDTLTNLREGTYIVRITDDTGCSTTRVFDLSPLVSSKQQYLFENEISVYPNPTDGLLTIDLSFDRPHEVQLQLQDYTGRIVKSFDRLLPGPKIQRESLQADLSGLPSGFYVLRFQVDGLIFYRKIINQ